MFAQPNEKVENYPAQLRKLKVGEFMHFDREFRNSVQKTIQRLSDEGLSYRIITKDQTIMVYRKETVINHGAEAIIKGLKIGEHFTRSLKRELESVSIIQEIKDKEFNITRDHSRGQLTITRIE